jgi:hypothetical protein
MLCKHRRKIIEALLPLQITHRYQVLISRGHLWTTRLHLTTPRRTTNLDEGIHRIHVHRMRSDIYVRVRLDVAELVDVEETFKAVRTTTFKQLLKTC